ncbi:MAG: hypothetical protein U1E29_18265 [Coriobacteriia bacterium]|nr:hypothetical protein [Coriobacteriia bacterium]
MRGSTSAGLLAYSSNTGLGVQTWEFAQHLHPAKVLLVDLSDLNGMAPHPERFADFECVHAKGIPTAEHIESFLADLDVVFVCETPLNYRLLERARELGVRTVLQPNHEFNDYHKRTLPLPDLFALPSPWGYDELPFLNKRILNVPVARERFRQQTPDSFRNFLHIAGRPAIHDRNGTRETLAAFSLLEQGDATLTVRIQDKAGADELRTLTADPRITIDDDDIGDYWRAYDGFDCLVMPRKYGGLCLPMQEALGSGIPVIMPAISPNSDVLPASWLVAAERTGSFLARTPIDLFETDAQSLAAKLSEFCAMAPEDVRGTCEVASGLGAALSWERQESVYRDVLGGVLA